jgi:hypothetical protein
MALRLMIFDNRIFEEADVGVEWRLNPDFVW